MLPEMGGIGSELDVARLPERRQGSVAAVGRELGNPLPRDAVRCGGQRRNLYLRGEYGAAMSATAEGAWEQRLS